MDTIMADSDNEDEGELNIARRTRSHLRIDDFEPKDNLDFPDVDMNLYRNPDSEGDTEYKKFLNQCYSEEIGTDTNATDDNDPAYVYNDDIFSHGWRFDLNEVRELHQDEQNYIDAKQLTIIEGTSEPIDRLASASTLPDYKSPVKPARRRIDMFADPEFARILNQQLRQHIQLLTQTFLLTKNTTNMRNEADEAKSHLCNYMKIFKHKSKPSNLLPALDLVNNLPTPKDVKSSIRLSWRPLPIPEPVKRIIHDNPNVFMYQSLLPQVAFSILPERLIPKKAKINFTINEDRLLAYALNEFKGEMAPYAFIASLLMTAKTKTQITNHIKNIKRSPDENNPIKLYFANGQLPEIDLDSDSQLVEISEEKGEEEEQAPAEEEQAPAEEKQAPVEEFEEDKGEVAHENTKEEEEETPVEAGMEDNNNLMQIFTNQEPGEGENNQVISGGEPEQVACDSYLSDFHPEHDDLMNMDLDDLMAASSTISKSTMLNAGNSENNKNIKNLKLKKSMLDLMSHNFLLSKNMGDLIIYEFLKAAQQKLSERNNHHLLQLLTDLMRKDVKEEGDDTIVTIYQEISKFLEAINAPPELLERVVLFLNLEQATKCGCSLSYLHWMRFFEFMQHVELYHDGVEALEKKLVRLIDALQKDDSHKVKLAIANLVNKHPFLKRQFESLSLEEKPHRSLFICEEDFDDITDPISAFNVTDDKLNIYNYENFNSKISKEELSYASPSCPCKCHSGAASEGQPTQHCGQCNLKFMKGRMYLVNKIKPILAEWTYTGRVKSPPAPAAMAPPQSLPQPAAPSPPKMSVAATNGTSGWTFEEDREILEFCRAKAEQNEETISFDTSTFEELVNSRRASAAGEENGFGGSGRSCRKKSAREIAERFNQLMEMYKDENSNNIQ